ncbi:AraC family transcriptional regulator, partial [Escherichia coli]|nr:AraC family transcriptional regulator [Escherichia coli]
HINSIANEVGYTSTSYFIRNFKEFFGITPKQFSLKVKKQS